jgi:hypothetical protein
MDSKEIETLLEKYWNCQTSLEEERILREVFAKSQLPNTTPDASELFRYFEQQRSKTGPNLDFDKSFIRQLKAAPKGGKTVSMLVNVAKIAAGLLVVVVASYLVMKEVRSSYPAEIADTYSDPKLALEETKKALLLISKGFGKAQKEASKIELFNEAERVIQRKPKEEVKLKM